MFEARNETTYVLVNTFMVVDGGVDALTKFQFAEMQEMGAEASACGWLGNEVFRSEDGASLIVVTSFRSVEADKQWSETERLRQHVRRPMSLVEGITSVPATLLATHGNGPLAGGAQ